MVDRNPLLTKFNRLKKALAYRRPDSASVQGMRQSIAATPISVPNREDEQAEALLKKILDLSKPENRILDCETT